MGRPVNHTMKLSLLVLLVFVLGLALANPQRRDRPDRRDRDRDRDRGDDRRRGGGGGRRRGGPKMGHKCLKPLIKSCDLSQYCEDPDEAGSFRPPLIIDKSKIESGSCPQVDDNMEDIEIEEEDRPDRCEDCPYCESRDSVDFCIICVEKNDDREPIVERAKEVSVDFACEIDWLDFKGKGRRCNDDEDREQRLIVDVCETDCRDA